MFFGCRIIVWAASYMRSLSTCRWFSYSSSCDSLSRTSPSSCSSRGASSCPRLLDCPLRSHRLSSLHGFFPICKRIDSGGSPNHSKTNPRPAKPISLASGSSSVNLTKPGEQSPDRCNNAESTRTAISLFSSVDYEDTHELPSTHRKA